jgi:hypothetical protein
MAALTRYTMLVFASSPTANAPSVFGSLANGTPTTATNVGTGASGVQGLSGSYESGWASAVVNLYSSAIEDQNAICWLFSYQLAYLFETGVPEWDSGTTYNTGDIVRQTGGNATLFSSISNSNSNNAITDGTNWQSVPLPGLFVQNSIPWTNSYTIPSGYTLVWPYLTIPGTTTVNVGSGAALVGINQITVTSPGIINVSGTGVLRVI